MTPIGAGAAGATGSSGGQAGAAGVRGAGQTASGAAGGGGLGEGEEGAAPKDIAGNATPASIPGLYGNSKELQIDVSRLPRLDEYDSLLGASADGQSPSALPSDVKTVAYYLRSPDAGSSSGQGQTTMLGSQSGLVRRELDRAVSKFASGNGSSDQLDLRAKLMAPEVTSLDFQYHDGEAWGSIWDSDAIGGLPMAIEIRVGIASPRSRQQQRAAGTGLSTPLLPADDDLIYRLVVRIPVAKPASEYTPAVSAEEPVEGAEPGTNTTPPGGAGTGAAGTGAASSTAGKGAGT